MKLVTMLYLMALAMLAQVASVSRRVGAWLAGLLVLSLSQVAGAVSVFDPITTAIDFTTVVAAIFAVAALFAAAYVTFRGVVWVIGMLRARPRA